MSEKEILREFWNDYKKIEENCFKFVRANQKELGQIQKNASSGNSDDWWYRFKNIKKYTINKNRYHVVLKGKLDKDKRPKIKTTTYLIFNNSSTGKKQVILLPAYERSNNLLLLDAKFFQDYKRINALDGLSFEDLVGRYMGENLKFVVYCDEENSDFFNAEFDMTVGIGLGHGEIKENYNRFEVYHLITSDEQDEMNKEMNTSITDPLKTWIKYRELNENKKDKINNTSYEYLDDDELERKRKEELNNIFEELCGLYE